MKKLFVSGLFKRYLVSYFLVAVVLIGLIGLILIEAITSTLEKEMSAIQLRRVAYINSIVEKSVLEPAEKLALDQLMTVQMANAPGTYADYELHKLLRGQIASMPFIESMNVYYPQERTLISSKGIKYESDAAPDARTVERLLNEQNRGLAIWLKSETDGYLWREDGMSGLVTYAKASVSRTAAGAPFFILSVNINETDLRGMLNQQLTGQNESLFVLGEQYRVVSQSGKLVNESGAIDFSGLLQDTGDHLTVKKVDGKNMMIISRYSAYNGWHYVLLMPLSEFLRVSFYIRNTILVVSISALVLGALLALLMSFNQYRPVRGIIANLLNNREQLPPVKNEIGFIQESIDQLHGSVNRLQSKAAENDLNKLLRGMIDAPGETDIAAWMPGDRFVAAAYRSGEAGWSISLRQRLETNLRAEVSNANGRVFTTPYSKDILVAVINFRDAEEATLESIGRASAEIGETVRCGIGPVVREAAELYVSCEGALEALKHHYLSAAASGPIYCRDICELEPFVIAREFAALVSAFDENRNEEIVRIVGGLAQALAAKRYRYASVELAVYRIIPLVAQKMMENSPGPGGSAIDTNRLADEFFAKPTIFESFAWLRELLAGLVAVRREDSNSLLLMQSVKRYIDEHYHEEISLELLSQATFISASYISQLFKKTFGVGVSDYVSQVRLDKAKRLLEDVNLKIETIAESVGMANSTYFITKFRRKFGMTPNQYRMQYKARQIES